MKYGCVLLCLAAQAATAETWSYWVQPCTEELARKSGCEAGDTELAHWALDAWQASRSGKLSFERAASEAKARLRIYWAHGAMGLYGEARPIRVDGQRGAEVYVLPDITQLGPGIAAMGRQDRLFRHAVVYLTCLHESGHAIGLDHTRDFDDIMYSFRYGGDIVEYFARYRRLLAGRDDIRKHAGIVLKVK